MIQREHILQKHLKLFVRDAVDEPHQFFSFDRGKAAGQWSHMIERARGVRKATPDTLLRVSLIQPIWYECKWPPNKPDEDQLRMGADLEALGDWWSWGVSVDHYRRFLVECGVRLRPSAEYLAMHADAAIASVIARAERKVPQPAGKPRTRTRRVTPGQVKRSIVLPGFRP